VQGEFMSCYGWERGEVQLPAAEFTKFKKALIELLTQRNAKLLDVANSIYTKIKEQKVKEKREFVYTQLRNQSLSSTEEYTVMESLLSKDNKLTKPKKQSFKLDKENLRFHDSDLTVILKKETKTVVYSTDDNNHAVDDARATFLGRQTLSLLEQVKFTSHTGGYFQSRTEYDDEASAARITKTFGKYKNPKHMKSLYRF
jgi:hypothetical protein